ncbi:MAG: adenylate/guanylate cyclase domain-containing protein [Alphaproteobacteria bacterium]|nr:adenylate/guanylate cyclase domain-containing protein [Alphaproteobacteria bacterium]
MALVHPWPKISLARWGPRRYVRLLWPEAAASSGRVREALQREEIAGYGFAFYGWLLALAAISLYTIATVPLRRSLFPLAVIAVFAALTGAGEWLRRYRPRSAGLSMAAILMVQIVLLTVVLILPNPAITEPAPVQLSFRFINFLFLYAFVIGTVLSFSPGTVLSAGCCAAAAWGVAFAIVYAQPATLSIGNASLLDLPDLTRDERLAIYLDPHYMSLVTLRTQIMLLLLSSAILALSVWRARRLVLRQAVAENARANLARYFSPNLVEELAAGENMIETSRATEVGVLFVDIVEFTALTERLPPQRTIELLRSFHTRMSDVVFRYGGTIDKYIGDEVMATFGTPRKRPDDACRLLDCACAMIAEIERWNAKRAQRGAAPVRVGIGVHYGAVIVGNVGGERCLEFTAIGDTVNVASRLERLTRDKAVAIAASGDAIEAMRRQGGAVERLSSPFEPAGPALLRGRAMPVELWVAQWPGPGAGMPA